MRAERVVMAACADELQKLAGYFMKKAPKTRAPLDAPEERAWRRSKKTKMQLRRRLNPRTERPALA